MGAPPPNKALQVTSERIVMIASFYAVVLKAPPLIAPSLTPTSRLGLLSCCS
jgi:hypothetical protein